MARKEAPKDYVQEMRRQLKEGVTVSCILLFGEERFLVSSFLKEIRDKVLHPETRALNEIVLEGRVKPADIMDACETYPVFAERKLVLVKNSDLMKVSRKAGPESVKHEASSPAAVEDAADEESDSEVEALQASGSGWDPKAGKGSETEEKTDWKGFFKDFPAHTLLVFVEENVNKTLSLYKQIQQNGLAAEMTFQKPEMLNRWLQKGFAQSGVQIMPSDADYLMLRAEEGMTSLHQEVKKICTYLGDKTRVQKEDIDAVVSPSITSRIFDLMDAVAAGQSARALQMLDDMLVKREPEQKIFYMIAKQAGRLLQVKYMEARLSSDVKANRLGMNSYAFSKMERLAARFSRETLGHFVKKAMEMDADTKSGRIKMRLALELLIVSLQATV